MKLEADDDDDVADVAEAGGTALASVTGRDATGSWTASSGAATEERWAAGAGGRGEDRRRNDMETVPGARSPSSPSKAALSDTVWAASSTAGNDTDRLNDRNTWLVFVCASV